MDVFHVYCFKSNGSYKHKLSRIESLVILYWGINCTFIQSRALYEQLANMQETNLESSLPSDKQFSPGGGESDPVTSASEGVTSPKYLSPPPYGTPSRKLSPKIEITDLSNSSSLPSPIPDIVPRGITLGDSVDNLDTSISRFSLPSPNKTYDFGEEEAELAAIVDRVDRMFPGDMSYGKNYNIQS